MSEELRTLRDFEEKYGEQLLDELKAEVVKWVKIYRKEDMYSELRSLMVFFNIKWEDLEEKEE